MKAVLVENRFPIPEEFQSKFKAIIAVAIQISSEHIKTSPDDYHIHSMALNEFSNDLYKEATTKLGLSYGAYPVWGVSDSCEELIGYRYEFQEEG